MIEQNLSVFYFFAILCKASEACRCKVEGGCEEWSEDKVGYRYSRVYENGDKGDVL